MNVFLALSWLEKIPDTVKAMALGRQGELHYKLKKDARSFRAGPLHLKENSQIVRHIRRAVRSMYLTESTITDSISIRESPK